MQNRPAFDLKLYLVTDTQLAEPNSVEWVVEQAIEGGVTMVQLREKMTPTRKFIEKARRLKSLLAPRNIPLIINDRLDIALAVDADGLHIGQEDMPYPLARKLLGPNKIIGLSIETFEQARLAQEYDVDYLGISAFTTPTKSDLGEPLGVDGIREIISFSKHRIVAIGGIKVHNAAVVMSAGVEGIAVVSAIVAAQNPRSAAYAFRQVIH